jgi:hypothetical protein
MSIDPSVKDRFIELRAQGLTYDLIAQELNVSRRTLLYWSEIFRPRIDALRVANLESLLDKYCGLQENRIKILGTKMNSLLHTLETRSLDSLPTGKLFGLVLQFSAALKKEDAAVRQAQENLPAKAYKSPDENPDG